jgi:predicted transglutaminase-like cysteine proteinase
MAAAVLAVVLAMPPANAASERPLFISVGTPVRAPIGWLEFCAEYAPECEPRAVEARDVVLSSKAWKDLVRINKWVNDTVKPITDLEHWGVVERWNYPDDGYGDCEDYVVRDKRGDGHAVLTVKTDKGEFILDNQNADILLWSDTGYRFVKRQSQSDPNAWVALGDTRPAPATAAAR